MLVGFFEDVATTAFRFAAEKIIAHAELADVVQQPSDADLADVFIG